MILYISLAFFVGCLAGITYMYLRYNGMMTEMLNELDQIRLNGAKIDGQLDILRLVYGIEEDSE